MTKMMRPLYGERADDSSLHHVVPDRIQASGPRGEVDPPRLDLRVLIIEGNPVSRQVLHQLASRIGCAAEVAADPARAIDSRGRGDYDLILMDVETPGLGGRPAADEIRRIEEERGLGRVPIVAMASDAIDPGRPLVEDAAFDGFVLKPVTRGQLLETLSYWSASGPRRPAVGSSVFDYDSLVVRCSGDHKFALELIGYFVAATSASMRVMGRALEVGAVLRMKAEAHGLAGSARTIGANLLADRCLELESTAGLGDLDGSRKLLDQVAHDWFTLRPIHDVRPGEIA